MSERQTPETRMDDRGTNQSQRSSAPGSNDFDRAVAEHHRQIRLLVYRLLGWRDGIEDVVQDVFLAAWTAWPRLRDRSSVEFWLKRIAVNKCRSRLRRQAVRRRWMRWMRDIFKQQSNPPVEQLIDKQEQSERVRSAIRELEPIYREVTVLHYLDHLSIDEMAELLGVRRNTVEVRLHRARSRLEKSLADLME